MQKEPSEKRAEGAPAGRLDLTGHFREGEKPRGEWKVGAEYENLAVSAPDGRALAYYGERGVEGILTRLASGTGLEPVKYEGHVIGLGGGGSGVSLEPGGQIELASAPRASVHDMHGDYAAFMDALTRAASGLGVSFPGLGMQPVSTLSEIEWIPKDRYRIMAPYMAKTGSLGHRMMKQTASVQAAVDYSGEADAARKFRAATGLVPLLSAIFANSPVSDGSLNGYKSYRGRVWTDTDDDRCGMLKLAFEGGGFYENYARYALEVPMYFICRGGVLIDMTGTPFSRYVREGRRGHSATEGDWTLHLSTLFPEVRLRQYIEIRCFDNVPYNMTAAVPAMIKGIFYDDGSLSGAWDLVKGWSWEERVEAYNGAHLHGPAGTVSGASMLGLCRELVRIASHGLKGMKVLNDKGEDESVYLAPVEEMLEDGRCPADYAAEKWLVYGGNEVGKFIEAFSVND